MMKTLRSLSILALLIVVSTISVKAQVNYDHIKFPYVNDSILHEDFTNNAWVFAGSEKYTLHPDRRPASVKVYQSGSSLPFLFEYNYDGNNRLSGYELKLNFGTGYITFNKLIITRDNNGKITEQLTQQIEQPGGPFINDEKSVFTYDGQGMLIKVEELEWDEDLTPAAWVNNMKTLYTYNANGKVETQIDSSWSTNNVYFFSNKLTSEYNAQGNVSIQYDKDAQDVIQRRYTYVYNASDFLVEKILDVKDGANYKLYAKDSAVYNSENRIMAEFSYNFDFVVNSPVLNERSTSLGSLVGVGSISNLMKEIKLYPNPTNGIAYISLNNSKESNVEVFNVSGEKVLEYNLKAGEKTVDLSSLSNGLYLLKVQSDGKLYQNKVVLNK